MIAAAQDDMDEYVPPSLLSGIKEKLLVSDLINQMEIADGLKELLISTGFTVKSLLNTSASDFAKILGMDEYVGKLIDEYVGKLLSDGVNKAIKTSTSIP